MIRRNTRPTVILAVFILAALAVLITACGATPTATPTPAPPTATKVPAPPTATTAPTAAVALAVATATTVPVPPTTTKAAAALTATSVPVAPTATAVPVVPTATKAPAATQPPAAPTATTAAASVSFAKDILPIFQKNCWSCHSGSSAHSGLSLTSYQGVMKGGLSAPDIVASNPEKSLLYTYVRDGVMPFGGPPLSASDVQKISDWIKAGALNN